MDINKVNVLSYLELLKSIAVRSGATELVAAGLGLVTIKAAARKIERAIQL